jgi:hypothetical protein
MDRFVGIGAVTKALGVSMVAEHTAGGSSAL